MSVKSINFFRQRQEILKERLIDLCVPVYQEAMGKVSLNLENEDEADMIANPVKYQAWHHSFNPHT